MSISRMKLPAAMVERMRITRAALALAIALLAHAASAQLPRPVPACAAEPRLAERGIGGTGIRPDGAQTADRGIGGTGIVGTITGFASVCINGLEVQYAPETPVSVDGVRSEVATLRVGQVAVIEAADQFQARGLAVEHEVSGPVMAVNQGGRVLIVAGQRVLLRPFTEGVRAPTVGDWVDVSGLRNPLGAIVASRIDPRSPGPVRVTGILRRQGSQLRIGMLVVRGAPLASLRRRVVVTGRFAGGAVVMESIADSDALPFDARVGRFLVEAYVKGERGRLRIGEILDATIGVAFGAVPQEAERAVVELSRGADGGLVAVGLREGGIGAHDTGGVSTAAPAATTTKSATVAPAAAVPATTSAPKGSSTKGGSIAAAGGGKGKAK